MEPDLFEAMRSWVDQRGQRDQLQPWLVYREGQQEDRPKRVAWVAFEDPSTMGQVTIWDTGECEVDLGSTTEAKRTSIRSVQVASSDELIRVVEKKL